MKENFSNLRAEAATDSITLYWERPEGCFGTQYQVFLGETLVGSTQKTHYTISDLKVDTSYEITVKGLYELQQQTTQTITVHTAKRTITIDITKEPYNAVNDGETLNTKAIQSAGWCFYDGCAKTSQRYGVILRKRSHLTGNSKSRRLSSTNLESF